MNKISTPPSSRFFHTLSRASTVIDQEYCPKNCHFEGMVGLKKCFPMHWLHNFGNPWNGFKERSNSYIPQVFLDTKIMGLLLVLITVF